ncbi:hypothetical protein C8R44DRAFT_20475 [Mycena epipterygia]|nr:hypothetical protein C8R44DRAFT_20475 [Mycena epipterygia]
MPPLPYDLILDIAERTRFADTFNLSLTSLEMRDALLPILYCSVVLRSGAACSSALSMLKRQPEVCKCIQELVVRPTNQPSSTMDDTEIDEVSVADQIVEIAPNLRRLHTLEWEGTKIPGDHLWTSLKNSCHLLKHIRCSLPWTEWNPGSQLFAFENLTAFTLCIRSDKHGFSVVKGGKFPSQLWDMLRRCPDLEVLTLTSWDSSIVYVPILDLTQGRWPRLRSLTLTLVQYEVEHRVDRLRAFLSSHPAIRHLAIHPKTWSTAPQNNAFLAPGILPLLDSFAGTVHHLDHISNAAGIRSLNLSSAPVSRTVFNNAVLSLRRFVSLTHLDLRLNHWPTSAEFHALFSACPALVSLRLTFVIYMAVVSEAIAITSLAQALRFLPRLRTFALEKAYQATDGTVPVRVALLLLPFARGLEEISLRWLDPRCHNGVKEEATFVIGDNSEGRYLEAWERGVEPNGDTFSRRYCHSLTADVGSDDLSSD